MDVAMPPFHGGGEMIMLVQLDSSTYKDPPYKFEAGTPSIADCIVWATAIDYLEGFGLAAIREHERQLTRYALAQLREGRAPPGCGPPAASSTCPGSCRRSRCSYPHDVAQV